MSEGGSLKERLKRADEAIDEEGKRWQAAGLSPIGQMYRMNDDEWLHHAHVMALRQVIIHEFDISEDELDLYLKEACLKMLKESFPLAKEAVEQAYRQQLAARMILPPGFNPNGDN